MQARQSKHFPELESLRGIAALVVVLYHCPAWVQAVYDITPLRNGRFAVTFFFVLSGFVICRAYGDRLKSGMDVLRFQFLRLGRVYPLHLAFLVLFIVMDGVKAMVGRPPFTPLDSPEAAVAQLFLVQLWSLDWALTFNGPSWSISVEVWLYLMFAVIVAALPRWRIGLFAGLAAAGLLGSYLTPEDGNRMLFHGMGGFFVGALLAWALREEMRVRWLAPASALALIVLLSTDRYTIASIYAVVPLFAGVIAGVVMDPGGAFARGLRWAPLQWLGKLSYSIYLSHMIVVLGVGVAVARLGYPSIPAQSVALGAAMYLAVIAGTLTLSWLTYHWIEKPCREASRRVVFERKAVVA